MEKRLWTYECAATTTPTREVMGDLAMGQGLVDSSANFCSKDTREVTAILTKVTDPCQPSLDQKGQAGEDGESVTGVPVPTLFHLGVWCDRGTCLGNKVTSLGNMVSSTMLDSRMPSTRDPS
ncbi:hypothetical protein ACLOJK_030267 [Asimina triloba]